MVKPSDRLSADYILGRDAALAEVYKGLDYIKRQLALMRDQHVAEGAGLGVGLVQLKLAQIEHEWRDGQTSQQT